MSGGVDSSVAVLLLQQAGYEVTGAYMKQWSEAADEHRVCTWKTDRRDALRVAAHLGIPLLTFDFEKEYRKHVLAYMYKEYRAGRTPNPDILCNKFVKFGVWQKTAHQLGFDFLATGHYAQRKESRGGIQLLAAKDTKKDQTYFLHQLSQKQLSKTLFPIGEYTKPEVRALARKYKLPTAAREESMGICFVGPVPMKEFLMKKIQPKPGNIVDASGKKIGRHDGLAFYTIGQRHFGQAAAKPLYVVAKNQRTSELIVGAQNDPLLFKKEMLVQHVNWIRGQAPVFPVHCKARLRHRQPLVGCTVERYKKAYMVRFAASQRAVTPGQFVVFYKQNECLGGGVI